VRFIRVIIKGRVEIRRGYKIRGRKERVKVKG